MEQNIEVIKENFEQEISIEKEAVSLGGIVPVGTLEITENGIYDVTEKANANVQVPQGVFPSGDINIVQNGTYDVTEKENAVVNVPQGVFPEGNIEITDNGTYDVTEKENAIVNVPQGVFPGGTLNITENGTFDVTNYASANVDVSSSDSALFDTYEGDVELYDDVNNLDIPIDVRNYDYIYGQAYCIATGTYQDGVVTETEKLTILPSSVCVYNQVFTTFPTMPLTMYRNETATTTSTPGNSGYSYSSAGMNFNGVGLINGCSVLNNSISLTSQNGGRKYCRNGYYHKFHYIVYAFKRRIVSS